jgi:peptidoglycan/xylan/chitin deacetylase (PgdA/CDA1 family)
MMNRRRFVWTLGAGLAAAGVGGARQRKGKDAPELAVTIDDVSTAESPKVSAEDRHKRLREALDYRKIKAAVFVCGKRVDSEEGRRLLRAWDDGGHLICNHTYTHPYYHSPKVAFEDFSQDAARGETVIKDFKNFRRLFRYPYLKEGDTPEKRDRMRAFLSERGYRMGYVTIDASDWYVEQRLVARLKEGQQVDLSGYKDFYFDHIWERASFYADLARRAVGRNVRHTLLLHDNLLNSYFLGDLLGMFEHKGWRLIDAARAFDDPVFHARPEIVPAGESIVWALAKESKKFEGLLRYPGEDGKYEKDKMDRLGL